MLKTYERLYLINKLTDCGLDLGLIKGYKPDHLLKVCERIETEQIPSDWYSGQQTIQKELCTNEQFFFYLDTMMAADGLTAAVVEGFIKTINTHYESVLDYPVGHVVDSMLVTLENGEDAGEFYCYLKNFSATAPDKQEAEIIISNIGLYQGILCIPITDMPAAEKALFKEKALMDSRLLPDRKDIGRAFNMLATTEGLLEVVRFFYTNDFSVKLGIDHYEAISLHPTEILDKLNVLNTMLSMLNMTRFIRRWLENNCTFFDLEFMCKHLAGMDCDACCDVLNTRSAYINFIYGSRFKSIPLSEISVYKESILIYAIVNKKTGFIRLIENNFDAFSALNTTSILLQREFYAKHFNINSLSASNLSDCSWMNAAKVLFDDLDVDKQYTFAEIKALYGLPTQYYKLYSSLSIPCVDKRLMTLRQLTKRKLLNGIVEEAHVVKIAEMLAQKPLSAWREQHFSHIAGVKPQVEVQLLLYWDEISKFVPQVTNQAEALLLVQNHDCLQNYATLDELKDNLIHVDENWKKLVKSLGLSDEFLSQHRDRVAEFLSKNGANIAYTYFSGLENESQHEALTRIVKAELMGELDKLKYYGDDLERELEYPIAKAQKTIWMNNTKTNVLDGFTVQECDDFFSTMQLGDIPSWTCISHKTGKHKATLLSGFDSNKKVLYAYDGDVAVGRAIIRLTKGAFSLSSETARPSLSFVDLEAVAEDQGINSTHATERNSSKERLIIFLERPYFSSVSGNKEKHIRDMFIELMARKAAAMGALLVLSSSYSNTSHENYVRTQFNVFISKSKAGAQYLDSLNGSANVSDEGGYRSNSFYIHSDSLV